jgi:hypothetical protein
MDEILIHAIVEKSEDQERKIAEIQTALKSISDNADKMEGITKELEATTNFLKLNPIHICEIRKLSDRLAESIKLLKEPVTRKVIHHHHFPKTSWIAAGLFIALSIVCSGWYLTSGKLEGYRANDTKYRFLKLCDNYALHELLYATDSLYHADKSMREEVGRREDSVRSRLEILESLQEKENELNRLKEKLK